MKGCRMAVPWVLALALIPVSARAQSPGCTAIITSVPYNITSQGVYCFDQNLAFSETGNVSAIFVSVNSVTIDMNGFRLTGSGSPASQATGIGGFNRKHITIRNGTVQRFYRGIVLGDQGGSEGHLIENVKAVQNTWAGIWVAGKGTIVRNNLVMGTGGSTVISPSDTMGIITLGPGARILGNIVQGTRGVGAGLGRGVRVYVGPGSVVEDNSVGDWTFADTTVGISVEGSTDVMVVDNRLGIVNFGVLYDGGSTGKYRANLTAGVTLPFTGGTDVGENN